jgi:hypothetical protein
MNFFIICALCQCNYNDQVKEGDTDRACSTNGEKRNGYRILVGTQAKLKCSVFYFLCS